MPDPKKDDDKRPGNRPRTKENDPHVQKEYRESGRDAMDPHRKDEVKPI